MLLFCWRAEEHLLIDYRNLGIGGRKEANTKYLSGMPPSRAQRPFALSTQYELLLHPPFVDPISIVRRLQDVPSNTILPNSLRLAQQTTRDVHA